MNVHTPLIGALLAVGALAATARGDRYSAAAHAEVTDRLRQLEDEA